MLILRVFIYNIYVNYLCAATAFAWSIYSQLSASSRTDGSRNVAPVSLSAWFFNHSISCRSSIVSVSSRSSSDERTPAKRWCIDVAAPGRASSTSHSSESGVERWDQLLVRDRFAGTAADAAAVVDVSAAVAGAVGIVAGIISVVGALAIAAFRIESRRRCVGRRTCPLALDDDDDDEALDDAEEAVVASSESSAVPIHVTRWLPPASCSHSKSSDELLADWFGDRRAGRFRRSVADSNRWASRHCNGMLSKSLPISRTSVLWQRSECICGCDVEFDDFMLSLPFVRVLLLGFGFSLV